MSGPALTRDVIEKAPKVLLHEHLDGGLRAQTVLDLAAEVHYEGLPTKDPVELRQWFIADTPGSDLVRYLDGFRHTTAVLQSKDHLERVASESALDLARDGVVYAEVRFAPELHVQQGLTLDEVVEAVLTGFAHGTKQAALEGARRLPRSPSPSVTTACAGSTSRGPRTASRQPSTYARSTSSNARTST
jgi:adenosine deaminase